jgi:hypothetical protein
VILKKHPQILNTVLTISLLYTAITWCYSTAIALSLRTPTQLLGCSCQSWTTPQRPISVRRIQTCPLTSLPLTGKFFFSELTQHCTFCRLQQKFDSFAARNATAVANAGTLHGVSPDVDQVLEPHSASVAVDQVYQINTSNPFTSCPSSLDASQVATITNTAPSLATNTAATVGYACNVCPSVFNRAGDLRRHYRKHFASQYVHDCHVPGCNRTGVNGFYRRDKLANHLRQRHGL